MHPRHSKYYIRRIRISATDALFKMLKDQGVPYYPEVGQSAENATTYVLEFAVKSPNGSTFRDDQSLSSNWNIGKWSKKITPSTIHQLPYRSVIVNG
jgi:hypothetical protein